MTDTTLGHYALGLAGLALLRRWMERGADTDTAYRQLIELATAAEDNEILQLRLGTRELGVVEGYTAWSSTYDTPNPLIDTDEAVTGPILAGLAEAGGRRRALDAGCGTGRKARTLVDLGYEVTGCDLTPAMLDVARISVPEATFVEAPFEQLPLEDSSVDLVTSSLAVCHVVDLEPVFAEFARVLAPGGRLVLSDPHPAMAYLGGQAFFRDELDMPYVRNQGRPISAYFGAATAAGLRVENLLEVPVDRSVTTTNPIHPIWPDVLDLALADLPWLFVLEASSA